MDENVSPNLNLFDMVLKGGPPWGFRIKEKNNTVIISKVSGPVLFPFLSLQHLEVYPVCKYFKLQHVFISRSTVVVGRTKMASNRTTSYLRSTIWR